MTDWIPEAFAAAVAAWVWIGGQLLPLLLPVVPVLALLWAMQSYRRGGSVVRVEFELGKLDAKGALLRAKPGAWRASESPAASLRVLLDPMNVDVAVVTVRNLGRTPSTISDVGLFVGRENAKPVHYGGILMAPGDIGSRHRVEAHDSRTFVFPLWGPVEQARADLNRVPITARAQVTTGTGRKRRSSVWMPWRAGETTYLGEKPDLGAEILREQITAGVSVSQLAGEIRLVLRLVESGASEADVFEAVVDPHGEPATLMRMVRIVGHAMGARDSTSS